MEVHKPDSFEGRAPLLEDCVLPFRVESASGRVVRLGEAVDAILTRHNYPESVSQLLGQAVVVTALLGTALKFDGILILQTKTDGPVDLLVTDYKSDGGLRGYAHFNSAKVEGLETTGQADSGALLGHGHLAMTIDQGPQTERYQGIVALEGDDINAAADTYFRQSEQIPTFIRVAIARHYGADKGNGHGSWTWRAGGLLVQQLGKEGERAAMESPSRDMSAGEVEDWNRVNYLAATVEDHELLDPMLPSKRLLFRLFHDERVRVHRPQALSIYCRCSQKRIKNILNQFTAEELSDMIENDKIVVTCEFCSHRYSFAPDRFVNRT